MTHHSPTLVARLAPLGLLALLVGCGGDEPPTAPIDGSTAPATAPATEPILSSGRLQALGVMQVNELAYDTTGAAVTVDGAVASLPELKVGQVAIVRGRTDASRGIAKAIQIDIDHIVRGTVTSIDLERQTFVVLGQTIAVDAYTAFDATVATLAALRVGDTLDVSGFRRSADDVIASRIDRQVDPTPQSRLLASVTANDPGTSRLTIGSLMVDYSSAARRPDVALSRNDPVEVRGRFDPATGTLHASSLELRARRLATATDTRIELEGFVTTVDSAQPPVFSVDGVTVRTTSTGLLGNLAVRDRVSIRGKVDANGSIDAQTVLAGTRAPSVMIADNVHIRVFDAVDGSVSSASMNVWVDTGGFGYSYTWARGGVPIVSSSDGASVATLPIGAKVTVAAYPDGYSQPCIKVFEVTASTDVQVEVIANARLRTAFPPSLRSMPDRVVTGTVFETSEQGRVPLPGAKVGAETVMDLVSAHTVSDDQGRYLLCGLSDARPWGFSIYALKNGYPLVYPVDKPVPGQPFDIELKR